MMRNIKVLGPALFAVCALSGLFAAAAQAETETAEFSWDSGTTRITAEEDPATPIHIFTLKTKGGGTVKVECDEPHAEATSLGGWGSKTVRVTNIEYSDTATTPGNPSTCTTTGGAKSVIKMNGCEYEFHAGTTTKEQTGAVDGESEGTIDIVCAAGKEIVAEAPGCTVKIKSQTGLGPVYNATETTTPESATTEVLIGTVPGAAHNKAITYSTEGVACGVQTNVANGTYTGNITLTGFDNSNNKTNVTVT